MKTLKWLTVVLALTSCAVQKTSTLQSVPAAGNTRTMEVKLIDDDTYLLSAVSDDKTYGYHQKNPIKVGGGRNGPANERRFLNGLRGPQGQVVNYHRQGSCCHFKTPNGLFDGTGLLDIYIVSWDGAEPVTLYLNMYDFGDLYIPVGFTARQK